jgi:6-phosphofructokinase 1
MRKIGILTGGGDVPGLNVVIKTFTARMEDKGCEVLGLRRGWASLLNSGRVSDLPESEWVLRLTVDNTRTIDRTGGTILHSSRTNPAAVRPSEIPPHLRAEAPEPGENGKVDLTQAAIRTLQDLGLEGLVAIGGDDTLSFARRLHQEGFPVVGVPKTMDNDVYGTDYCVGFSTAISRSVNMITDLRSPAGSHERILVVELFGRYSGETSLMVALLAQCNRALISEVPFEPDKVVDLITKDRWENPSHYAVLTVSEGSTFEGGTMMLSGEEDAFGHRKLGGIGKEVAEYIKKKSGIGIVYQNLGYLMRSGAADALDRLVAINYARIAADLLLRGEAGRLVCIREGRYATESLSIVGEGTRTVNVDRYYDVEHYRPKLGSVVGYPMFLE